MGDERTVSEVVGMNVSGLRTAAGLTQAQLAGAMSRLGFPWHRQTVTEVEAGRRPVSLEEVAVLAAYFDMPAQALIVSPGLMLTWSADVEGVRVGDKTIRGGDWAALWLNTVRMSSTPDEGLKSYWEIPPGRGLAGAIDKLWKGERRPWSRVWRKDGGHAAASFKQVREGALAKRRKHPGPVFVLTGTEPTRFGVGIPPWGESYEVEIRPGEPYVARDPNEAGALRGWERAGLVRQISRQSAYRLRRRLRERELGKD